MRRRETERDREKRGIDRKREKDIGRDIERQRVAERERQREAVLT